MIKAILLSALIAQADPQVIYMDMHGMQEPNRESRIKQCALFVPRQSWRGLKACGRGLLWVNSRKPVQNGAAIFDTISKYAGGTYFIYRIITPGK